MGAVWGWVFLLPAICSGISLTAEEAQHGWVMLFDGKTVFGWNADPGTKWRVEDGVLIGEGDRPGWIRTNASFGYYELHCEFRGGRMTVGGSGRNSGYRLPTGKKLERGRWHSYDVLNHPEGFVVMLDDAQIASGKEKGNVAGVIGLELRRSHKVEFRDIRLKPLGLKPLNSRNSKAGLRTQERFADFLLQFQVRAKPPLDGRVSLRGGCEVQIRNEWDGDGRSRPVDFGIGGIYGKQPARPVDPEPGDWLTVTVSAGGRNVAVWVDGFEVTDWTDASRRETWLAPDAISLHAHDPAGNLELRDIAIAGLPR